MDTPDLRDYEQESKKYVYPKEYDWRFDCKIASSSKKVPD